MSKYICLECGDITERNCKNDYQYSFCDKKNKHVMLVKLGCDRIEQDLTIMKVIRKMSTACKKRDRRCDKCIKFKKLCDMTCDDPAHFNFKKLYQEAKKAV